ncbi:MAG: cytochrome P450 [Methylotetracoccus sp.]
MAPIRALILRALTAWPALIRLAGWLAPNPFAYVQGKPLERWLPVYRLGARKLALTNDPVNVELVMQDRSGQYPKAHALETLLEPLIGRGVFGQPGGASVREARKLYIRSLARIDDGEIIRACRELTDAYVDRWLGNPQAPLALCTELSRLTVDVVSRCTLGRTFEPHQSERFSELFFLYHRRCVPLLLLLSDGHPSSDEALVRGMRLRPIGTEMRQLIRDCFVRPLLAGDHAALAAPFAVSLREAGLLEPGDDGERTLDEIAVMLLAGHETTASTLSWLLWELARRPEQQDTAADALIPEVDDIDRAASGPDTVRAMIRETLRLYPPIAFFLRQAEQATTLRGKPVAAGDFVVVSPWTLHRHRKLWTRPGEFIPERWLAPDAGPTARTSFMPFGMGPRTCPGAHFADVELREILRPILRRCRLSPAGGRAPRPLGSLTSRPDREIRLRIAPRGTMR